MILFRILLFFLVFCFHYSFAQQVYKNIVFEGAGIRGIAYGGVVQELQEQGILDSIEKVGGTSAGAIIALTISLGYTGEEITKIIHDTDFNKFNSGHFIFFGGVHRMRNHYGWYRGDKFSKWLGKIIEKKTGNPDITFKELSEKGFKDLYTTGISLNNQKFLIFSKEKYPDMKVRDAVQISMSIPLYFEAIFIDAKGHVHKKPKSTDSLDLVVDGGLLGNFPIQIFDSTVIENGIVKRIINPYSIGVRIDSEEQIKYDRTSRQLAPIDINNLKDYIQAFYNIVLENLNRQQLTQEDWARTISVSSVGIGPKIKKLSAVEKQALIDSGKKGVREFLGIK